MKNNSFTKIAGVAGILSPVFLLIGLLTLNPAQDTPSTLFIPLMIISSLFGILFVTGLYLIYRNEKEILALVTLLVVVSGYLLFIYISLDSMSWNSVPVAIADILVYVVGIPLFSWLAYRTAKTGCTLPIIGFLAGLTGLVIYTIRFGAGVDFMIPAEPIAIVMGILFFPYTILVVIWQVWTGYLLLSGKLRGGVKTPV